MTHTPGPWFVQQSDHPGGLLVKPVPGQVVAQCDELPEMEANANLIAAAPNMLKVLELIEIQMSYQHAPDADMQKVMLASVRGVIAKAKGK